MTFSKTLMLAAVAVASIGVGSAMADGSGGTFPDYQSLRLMAPHNQGYIPGDAIQSGSSDVLSPTGADHSAAYILDHHLAGAGGVAG